MRIILIVICVFGLLGIAEADEGNRHRDYLYGKDARKTDHRILHQLKEMKQMLVEMQKEIRELRHLLRHRDRRGASLEGSWGCSVQPPWNEPAFYGVGSSKAIAIQEALNRCSSGASSENRKYCTEGRASCNEQIR